MRTATYLIGAALVAAMVVGGAALLQRSTTGTPDPAGQEGPTVTTPHNPTSENEPEIEDDYDVSLEDPVVGEGEPTNTEELWRDSMEGQYPDGPAPAPEPGPPGISGTVLRGTFEDS